MTPKRNITVAILLAIAVAIPSTGLATATGEVSAERADNYNPSPQGYTNNGSKQLTSKSPCKTVTPEVWNRYIRKLDDLTNRKHHKASRKVCKAKLYPLIRRVKAAERKLETNPRYAIPRAFEDAGIAWRTSEAMRVAYCESTLNRFATNGQYAGLFQLSSAHQARMKGSPFHAYDNARHAANTVRADGGWGQWECKP